MQTANAKTLLVTKLDTKLGGSGAGGGGGKGSAAQLAECKSCRCHRNCIGFGSGVLGGFAGFCFCFCFLGSGRWAPGLWFALGSADWVVLIEVYCFSPGAGFDRAVC